jgi:hypothetical protein
MQPNNNHILQYKYKIRSKPNPYVIDSPSLPHDTHIKVTFVARPLLMPAAQKLCRCKHDVFISRMCSSSNTASHKSCASISEALPLYSLRTGTWSAMSQRQTVRPMHSEKTSNAEQYQNFLTQFLSMLAENERDYSFLHMQQWPTMWTNLLYSKFLGKWTVGCDLWPLWSPDFTPPSFIL